MVPATTRKSLIFIILGACLVALAIALNVSWIVINWRAGVLLVLGIVFFLLIIAGLVLNTIFLVREVRGTNARRVIHAGPRPESRRSSLSSDLHGGLRGNAESRISGDGRCHYDRLAGAPQG